MWAENEPIYPAPRNAVREHGRKRGYGGQNRLVLARLVWPSGAVVVPARLLWVDDDVVCVEWQRRRVVRHRWIPRADVAGWLPL